MRKLSFGIGLALLLLFASAGVFFTVLHSSWGRDRVLSSLTDELRTSGWKLIVEKSSGTPFEKLELENITLESPRGDLFTIGSLKTNLSVIRLLKKEIAFQDFQADRVLWIPSSQEAPALQASEPAKGIPFSLVFSNILLTNVSLPESESLATLKGSLRIGRYQRRIRLNMSATRQDAPTTLASLSLTVRPNQKAYLTVDLSTDSFIAALSPWILLPADGSADLHLYAKGNWQTKTAKGYLSGSVDVTKAEPLFEREWKVSSFLELNKERELHVSKLSLRGEGGISAKGDLLFSKDFSLKESQSQLTVENLKQTDLVPLDGFFLAHLQTTEDLATLTFSSPHLTWETLSMENAVGRLHMHRCECAWSGVFDLTAKINGESTSAMSQVAWQSGAPLQISEITVTSPLAKLSGDLTIYSDRKIEGQLHSTADNLHEFNAFNPFWPLYGKGEIDLRWNIVNEKQLIEIDAKGSDLFYKNLQAESVFLYGDVSEESGSVLYLELQDVNYQTLQINTLSIDSESADGLSWPTHLLVEGDWRGAFSIAADGTWHLKTPNLLIDLQDLNGTLFSQPLALITPTEIELGKELFRLKELDLTLGAADLLANIDYQKDATNASLLLNRVPLDFLSLNPLEISVAGLINLDAKLTEKKGETSGTMHAEIVDVQIGAFEAERAVEGHSLIDAELSNERLNLAASMNVRGEKILNLTADLPYRFNIYPFLSEPLLEKKARGALSFNGKIEEILDFFNIGPHRLEGTTACDVTLRGTLGHPILKGTCHLKDGYYENYYSGTELKNIQAEFLADHHTFYLRSLTAEDGQGKGKLTLSGNAKLSAKERFPFRFDGEFTRLQTTDLAWLKMEAGGTLQISGNADSARISGQAIVLEGDITIPKQLPPALPDLQVKYVNAPKPLEIQEANLEERNRYPIFFDYRVFAPEGISIAGRGLKSEWKGDFRIGGTYTELEAKGQLDMLKGDFSFSGRDFKLSEGSLTFTGKPQEMPIINIAANLDMPNLAIIARLKGYINAPQISFQSKPPLPMGSILSYLLFGQDLSQISAIQAAQLVNSLSTLSGNSSGDSKRSLGVDRLRIVATPVGNEGAEAYSLQVGKYVTRGVLVSVTQGLRSGSTNLAVEIDLANGFVFEAASQQQIEQGKFAIKWHYNY